MRSADVIPAHELDIRRLARLERELQKWRGYLTDGHGPIEAQINARTIEARIAALHDHAA